MNASDDEDADLRRRATELAEELWDMIPDGENSRLVRAALGALTGVTFCAMHDHGVPPEEGILALFDRWAALTRETLAETLATMRPHS